MPPEEDASMYPPGEEEDDYIPTVGAGGRRKGPGVFGGGMSGGAVSFKASKGAAANTKKKGRGTFTY